MMRTAAAPVPFLGPTNTILVDFYNTSSAAQNPTACDADDPGAFRPSSVPGGASQSIRHEQEDQVCWDIETYKLVTVSEEATTIYVFHKCRRQKRVEDLEAENRLLRSKVIEMASENSVLRERLESETDSRSLTQLLKELREASREATPPSHAHLLACDYDHVFRMDDVSQTSPSHWTASTAASRSVVQLDQIEEPKLWDIQVLMILELLCIQSIQSVVSSSLVGDTITPQCRPKFPLLDDSSCNAFHS